MEKFTTFGPYWVFSSSYLAWCTICILTRKNNYTLRNLTAVFLFWGLILWLAPYIPWFLKPLIPIYDRLFLYMTTYSLLLGFFNKDAVLYVKEGRKMRVYEVEKNTFNYISTIFNCILSVVFSKFEKLINTILISKLFNKYFK